MLLPQGVREGQHARQRAQALEEPNAILEWKGQAQANVPKRNRKFPRLLSGLGKERGTDRNRRVSAPLSPILYLFLAPSGILYQKVQRLLAVDQTTEGSHPPVVMKHRRPGPKHPAYGIAASQWPIVMHRVVEQKEPLRTVAAAYGVSHETIRRIMLHVHQH